MKATELMIGDLINGFGVVRRVTSIFGLERPEDDGLLTTMIPGCEFPESNLSFRPCYARPIPLTAEILGKNGFVHRQSVTWGDVFTYTYAIVQKDKVLQYEQYFNLSPNPYDGSGIYWIPEMSAVSALRVVYVHELQHLLRLCGIEKDIIEL